ncbi:MAG: metalloprotease [Bacteroidetes bacterium 13_1_20CM_4_60_6]|nr:MAG: metalloprotease [Bacteroidetes bacterium 13_1_20CM_4_60_6]
MLWQGRSESENVEDRRGISGGHVAIGGGIIGAIFLVVKFLLGGGDPSQLPQQLPQQSQPMSAEEKAADDERARFVKVVLRDTEDIWAELFKKMGKNYNDPTLVLFREATQSGCGYASSVTGPFYCPSDDKLYIDLSFYQELQERFKAPGDFAMAYVVAHEVGHHVQNLLGISKKMANLRQQLSEGEYNKYSVKLELQADFFAGVWAHYEQGKNLLEAGDVQEALAAAEAIGDDRLQKETQGYVVPESFTHGTSQQRMYWFKKGFETGDVRQGDTFDDPSLR